MLSGERISACDARRFEAMSAISKSNLYIDPEMSNSK